MRLRVLARSWLFVLLAGVLSLHGLPAWAGPAPGLCAVDASRGTVPASFPVQACLGVASLVVRNDLSVPIELSLSGGLGSPSVAQLDQSPGALVARAIINRDRVLLPGDVATIPLTGGAGTLRIAGTTGGDVYILSQTLSAFFPVGEAAKNALDALTGLVTDIADAAMTARNCRSGQNWIGQRACDLVYNTTVVLYVGKALIKGLLAGPASLIVSTIEWMRLVDAQVPSVRTVLEGDREIHVVAPEATASATSSPSPTRDSPWPTRDSEGPPALYAWLGANFFNMPKWVSCTSSHCLVDQGASVMVIRISGLVKLGTVPTSSSDPAGQLMLLGLDSVTVQGLLTPGRT